MSKDAGKGQFLSIHIKLGKRSPCTSDFVIEVSLDDRLLHPIPLKRNNNTELVVDGWFAHDEEDNMLARIPFMLGQVVSHFRASERRLPHLERVLLLERALMRTACRAPGAK